MKALPKQLINKNVQLISRAGSTVTSQEPERIEKSKTSFIILSFANFFKFLAINNVQLLGRVGGDPQKKGTEDRPVVIFSLATHLNYRYESGEFLQKTEWHRVVCFKPGLRDTIMNYLKKGQRVHVTGRITYGEIKGDDGSTRFTTAINADEVIFFHQ